MRNALFRAKNIDRGNKNEWVFGGLLHQTDYYGDKVDRYYIIDGTTTNDYDIGDNYRVNPATIGEFTGYKDRRGIPIYEMDIVEFIHSGVVTETRPKQVEKVLIWYCFENSCRSAIFLDNCGFNGNDFYNYDDIPYSEWCVMMIDPWNDFEDIRVVGNIIDNPEHVEKFINEYYELNDYLAKRGDDDK